MSVNRAPEDYHTHNTGLSKVAGHWRQITVYISMCHRLLIHYKEAPHNAPCYTLSCISTHFTGQNFDSPDNMER